MLQNNTISDTLRWISHPPLPTVITYLSYVVNGINYNTEDRDNCRNVQNSGVCLTARTMQISSAKDKNPVVSNMSFYGVIQEIWELNYVDIHIPMFKCNWIESNSGVRTDELGFKLVDLKRIGHRSDSFILASQAKQVFYIEDPSNSRWSVVLQPPSREYEDHMHEDELGDTTLNCVNSNYNPFTNTSDEIADEDSSIYVRTDCDGIWIDNENET